MNLLIELIEPVFIIATVTVGAAAAKSKGRQFMCGLQRSVNLVSVCGRYRKNNKHVHVKTRLGDDGQLTEV